MKRKISVIGLGYVGLPVAVAFGDKAKVIGYDINKKRVAELQECIDTNREVEPEELKTANIHFTINSKSKMKPVKYSTWGLTVLAS